MMGERPATTSENSTNVGTEDITGESDRYEHLSQTGEEFSAEFIRDRLGIKRVNVMPNVDHFQPRGYFGNDKPASSYYEDVRSPFNCETPNTDCGMRGSAFYNSPIVQNPIRIPFSHVRTSSGGGHGHEEASPCEAVPDPLVTLLSLTESSPSNKLKFLCSYGGRILPTPSDSRLRYVGGETRIISIRRNISWDELVRKTAAICNQPHMIKYKLPWEDLDALISVCSDEDLLNMIEEYGELEKNGNSQRLRIFLVSLSESESPSSFEVRSEQQQGVDYQYVVAVHGMFDPSPQKSANVGNQVFHLGGSSLDHSPGGQSRRDSPTYFQAMEASDNSPSSHLRLTPHILTAPLEVHNDVSKILHDNSYYSGGNDCYPSSANKLLVLYNCSTEDGPISSNRSLQLLNPSSMDEDPSVRTMFDESQVIPLENVVRYSDDPTSWHVKSMEKNVPKHRIVHTLSDAQLQGYGEGYAKFVEQGAGGVACTVNISAENVPLLACSSPSQEWYMKSQDIKKEHSCNPENVVLTNEARNSNGDQGGVISSLIDTDITVPSRDNREVSADSLAENNSRSYQVSLGGQSQRDSPTYFQAMEARDYSPSSHLRLTSHILTAPLEDRNDVSKTLHDNSYYYGGNDGYPSSADKLHVLYNCSMEDGPVRSNGSLQLLIPSSTDKDPSVRTMFDESRVIPLENVVCYSDDPVSWHKKSMEKDVPKYRIMHTLSDAQLQGYGEGYAKFVEQGAGGVSCTVNISAENVPLLAYSSPSQEWYMKSQDIKKEHSCDPENVVLTNEARTSNGDQGGVISNLIDTDITVPSRDNREVSADSLAENNSRSYQVSLPVTESVVNSAIDQVSSYRISVTSSAIEEGFWEINTAKVLGQRDNEIESNPTNTNKSVRDKRGDRGSVRPLIVEDVTEKVMEDIPTSKKFVPHVQHDPQLIESNVSSPKEFKGSLTPETDYEDVKSDDQDDSEDPISDAAMAEIEAGIYGLQIIKNADLEELRELGSGIFGTVYHGKWKGTDVAIKRIKKSCFVGLLSEQERIMKEFWREAKILSNLHHPNVVAFYGVVPDGPGGTLVTVTEFMVNGSLRHNLKRNSRLLDRRRKVMIAMDAAFGMEYLHLKNIVHFDLKCDNLLVNLKDPRRPICKVGDFGLSRIKQNTLVSGGIRGTLPWMAPELLNGTNSRVSEKVDIYSFGIAMWEMLTGEEPYPNMHCGAIIGGIVNNNLRPPIPDRCDNKWRKLMEECWSAEPSCRPSFTEVTLRLQEMLKTLQPKQRYSSSENKSK